MCPLISEGRIMKEQSWKWCVIAKLFVFTITLLVGGCTLITSEDNASTTAPLCTSVTLTVTPTGAVAIGTTLTLNATATCGSGETPQYLFQYQREGTTTWTLIRTWGTGASTTWSTTGLPSGKYLINVQARRSTSTGAAESSVYGATLVGNVCTAVTPTASPTTPVPIGGTVTVNATATCTGGTPEYQYWYAPSSGTNFVLLRDWGPAAGSWDTTGVVSAQYTIMVRARVVGNTSTAEATGYTTALVGNVCSGVTLTVSPSSPRLLGSPVTLTASATCLGNVQPEYRFYQYGTSSDIAPWGPASSVTWNTSTLSAGTYALYVYVRGAGNPSGYEALKSVSYQLITSCTPDMPDTDGDGVPDPCDSCDDGVDTDGDGFSDCQEQADSSAWTDAQIFNGPFAERGSACGISAADVVNEANVDQCLSTHPPVQGQNLRAAWKWTNVDTSNSCNSAFGFNPAWSICPNPWYIHYNASISLENTGYHCFSVHGPATTALFFDGTPIAVGSGPQCFQRRSGGFPIRWYWEPQPNTAASLDVRYCYGGSVTCTPLNPIPQQLLRTRPRAAGPADVCTAAVQPPAGPAICGDGVREASSNEECDDGNSNTSDLCSSTCRVQDGLIAPPVTPAPPRRPGAGRHAVSSGCEGFGVAFVEGDSLPSVSLSVFDKLGRPNRVVKNVSVGSNPLNAANPVIASISPTRFAVAWNDFGGDGDQRGVALRLVDSAVAPSGPPQFANAAGSFSQYDPDIVRTASEVVVAWQDESVFAVGPDIRFRRFNFSLTPTTFGDETLAATAQAEFGVALSSFGSSWAGAWRTAAVDGGEIISATAGSNGWQTESHVPGPAADKPSLVELDATHLLAVFTVGSVSGRYTLAGAVFDTAHPGPVTSFGIAPMAVVDSRISHTQPSAVRANGRVYLSWRSSAPIADANAEDVWLKEITWTTNAGAITLDLSRVEIPLGRKTQHGLGDQRTPGIASVNLWPNDALAAVWEDDGRVFGAGEGAPDLAVEFVPLPVLRMVDGN